MRIERLTPTPQLESHKLPPSSTVVCPLDKNRRSHTKTVGSQPEMSMSSVKGYTTIAQNKWSSSSSSSSSKKGEPTMARKQRKKGTTVFLKSTPHKKTLEEEINVRKEKEERKSLKNKRKKDQGTGRTEVTNQPRNIKTEKEKISTEKRKRMIEVMKTSLKSSEDDCPCVFCGELNKASMDGEGCSRCYVCHKWAYDACARIEEDDDDNFQCDF
ncbi:hypothetical protein PR048_027999, partial [Dryococelus australis]